MKLSALYEGYFTVVKSHPGGLGDSGHTNLRGKERLSFLDDDRDEFFGGLLTTKYIKTGTKYQPKPLR